MKGQVEFFCSLQSPYCYFALDSLDNLSRDYQIEILISPVLPGVIRIPDAYPIRIPDAYPIRIPDAYLIILHRSDRDAGAGCSGIGL